MTKVLKVAASRPDTFQYRKRYEVTCDFVLKSLRRKVSAFQYRKRYEVTCDVVYVYPNKLYPLCFNTASGMRSHVTASVISLRHRRSAYVSIPQAV